MAETHIGFGESAATIIDVVRRDSIDTLVVGRRERGQLARQALRMHPFGCDRRWPRMDAAYISAFAALGGSVVGALTSFVTTWLTLNSQERANRAARETTRRENLYGQFIEEAAKLYTDAL